MSREDLPTQEILKILSNYRVTSPRLFGSRARGDNHPGSDLDLLIEAPRGMTLLDLAGLKIELEELLGLRVDIVTEAGLRPRLRERILAEAKPLVAA